MVRVKGANGAVIVVSEGLAKSLVGDGSHGHSVMPDPSDKPEPAPKAAPKRTTTRRKTTT